jgi:hypothetical protein
VRATSLCFLAFVFFAANSAFSADPGFWVQGMGGTGSDSGAAVTLDAAGSVFLTGSFSTSVNFGSTVLTSAGGRDIFLAKFDANGTMQWIQSFGSTGDEFVTAMMLDSGGNIFLGGYFGGTGNFGGASALSVGGWDFFIVKYTPQGAFSWSRTVGGTSDDVVTSMALDLAQNNLLITGHFQGSVNFGTTSIASADTGTDTFLAKYSAVDGAPIWAKNFPNRGYDTGMGIFVDRSDNIFLAGYFGTRIDLGGGILYSAGTGGLNDFYLAKYAPSGSIAPGAPIWSKRYGGVNGESLYTAALDRNGDLVVGGVFSKQTDLGGGAIVGTGMDTDMFLAKYSSLDGSHLWGRALLCGQGGGPRSIGFDSVNNLLVCGYFYGTCNFGAQTLSSAGSSWDVFVSKYSGAGTPLWAERFGGVGGDDCYGTAVGSNNNYFPVTGSFSGTVGFNGTNLSSAGLGDIFLLRVHP